MKENLKKIGKAALLALPWIGLVIWLTCLYSLPLIHASERAELTSQIAALEAENAMYESENARLDEEVDWLRSLIGQRGYEEAGDGQIQQ